MILRWYAEFIVITKSVKERHGHTLKYKTWSDDVQRKRTITLLLTTSRNTRHSILMPLVHLYTGSIMLLVVMLSIRLSVCLPVCPL